MDSCPVHSTNSWKPGRARCMLRSYPDLWFRKATIEDRDRALLDAEPVSFVEYGNASYLRKI
ncbi:hypothetical protein MMC10_010998, partial [Thelotrema lepadinum]|nr:hypothetical protein [Thelotrema lepadinum]